MAHTRGAPYHPQTQGKIERYHRTMKNVVKLQYDYFPWELEAALRDFVTYYNNERYHEAIGSVTPADACLGGGTRCSPNDRGSSSERWSEGRRSTSLRKRLRSKIETVS
jgi:putative transposase